MEKIDVTDNHAIWVNAAFFNEIEKINWLNDTDALFATTNAGFGGYSQCFVNDVVSRRFQKRIIQFHPLNEIGDKSFDELPVCIYTPESHTADGAEQLIAKIIQESYKQGLKNIRLCQMMYLNSSQQELFFCYRSSVLESSKKWLGQHPSK
jgi:hypothetical protein